MTESLAGPMQGYRVLDLCGELGLYCTKILADLGAAVLRIEPPQGDPVRWDEPFAGDEPGPERSLHHLYFNAGKRGITLDIDKPEGRQLFQRLAEGADVVVEAFQPGHLAGLGVGYEDLCRANRRLIMTSITGFGQTGPHAQWQSSDLVALAASGVLTLSGFVDRPPYRPYPPQSVYCAGIEGANGTLLAVLEREASGVGQWIDVSAQESLSMAQETAMQLWDFQHRARPRTGRLTEAGIGSINECADGYIYGMFGLLGRGATVADLVRWMDEDGLAEDLITGGVLAELEAATAAVRGAGTVQARTAAMQNQELLARAVPAIRRFLKTKTKDYLYREGQRRGFFVAAVNDTKDIVESPQLRHQNWFQQVDHPELGRTLEFPGVPYAFGESPARSRVRAPLLGEHNDDVYLGELGLAEAELARLKVEGVI